MAEEAASIGIKLDTSDVLGGIKSLEVLAQQGPKVEKAMAGVEGAAAKTGKSLKTMGEGSTKGLDDISKSAPQAADGIGRVARSADDAKRALAGINASVAGLGQVTTAAGQSARGMTDFSASLRASQKSLADMQVQVSAASAAVAQMGSVLTAAVPSMQAAAKAQADAAKSAVDMGGAFKAASDQVRSYSTVTVGAAKSMDATAVAARALGAALAVAGVGFGAQELITMVDGYTKFTAQLKLATKGASDYGVAMVSVKRIAADAQQGLGEVGTLYARIANGTAELGLSQRKLADITETVSLALKVSGATASESSSAMLQLSQAFASGVLRGEEFNSVNEAAPRLMKALADGINVPVGALRKMAEEGKLTSAVLSEALPKALGQLREEAKEVQTIGGALTVLKNNIMEMVGSQSNASGTTKALASGINALANNLDLAVAAGAAVATIFAGRVAASMVATGVAFAASTAEAVRYQATLATMAGVSNAAAASMVTMGVAARGASAALSFFGGPVGAIITAVGLAATAFYAFGDSSGKLVSQIGGLNQPLDDLRRKIDALPPEKRIAIVLDIKEEAAKKAKEAASSFDDLAANVVGAFSGARAASADSAKQVNDLVAKLEDAKKTGADMTPILLQAAKAAGVSEATKRSWLDLAANIRAANEAAKAGDLTSGAGGGRGSINPPTIGEIEKAAAEARKVTQSALDALSLKKGGFTKEWLAELKTWDDALKLGMKTPQEYAAHVTEMNKKRYESTEAGKEAAKQAKAGAAGVNDALSAVVQGFKNADKAILDGRKDFYDQIGLYAKLGTKSELEVIDASLEKEDEVWAKRKANFEAELAQAGKKKGSLTEVARITGAMQDAERDYLQNVAKLRGDAALAEAKVQDAMEARITQMQSAAGANRAQILLAQQEAKAVGLTGDALREFNKERLGSGIPLSLKMQAAWADEAGELGRLGKAARDQIETINDLAKAQGEARAKQLVYDYTKSISDNNRLLQAEIDLMGESERVRETALAQIRIQLDLEKQIAAVKASMGDTPERAQMIASLESSAAIAKANAASRVFLDEWKESVKQYDEVFRRGFADMVNNGKGSWKSFTKSLATTFKTTVADQIYKIFLQPFVVRVAAQLVGVSGGSGAGSLLGSGGSGVGSALSSLSGISKLSSLFGGGTTAGTSITSLGYANAVGLAGGDAIGALAAANAQWAGVATGAQAAAQAAVAANAALEAGTAVALEAGTLATAGGAAGAGGLSAALGAIPGWGWALAGGALLLGSMDFGSRGANHTGGAYSTSTGDRNAAASQALGSDAWGNALGDITQRANTALDAQLGKTVDALSGVYTSLAKYAGSSAKQIDIAAAFAVNPAHGDEDNYGYFRLIDKITGEALSTYKARDGVLGTDPTQAYAKFVGEMGGALVEQLKAADIPGWMRSIFDGLGSDITVDGLNKALQAIAAVDSAFKGWADTLQGFSGLSAEVQTALLNTSGGLDALAGNVNTFYGSFYSEQERMATLQRQVLQQLAGLDVTVDTSTAEAAKESFRKTVEGALDAGNAELAAKLLAMSGSFATAADYAANAAEEAAKVAEDAASKTAAAAEEAARALAELRKQAAGIVQSQQQSLDSLIAGLQRKAEQANGGYVGSLWLSGAEFTQFSGFADQLDGATQALAQLQALGLGDELAGYADQIGAIVQQTKEALSGALSSQRLMAGDAAGAMAAALSSSTLNYAQFTGANGFSAGAFNRAFASEQAAAAAGLLGQAKANSLSIPNVGDVIGLLAGQVSEYAYTSTLQDLRVQGREQLGPMVAGLFDELYNRMAMGAADGKLIAGDPTAKTWAPGYGTIIGSDLRTVVSAMQSVNGALSGGRISADEAAKALEYLNTTFADMVPLLEDTAAQYARAADFGAAGAMSSLNALNGAFGQLAGIVGKLDDAAKAANSSLGQATNAIGLLNSMATVFGNAGMGGADSARGAVDAYNMAAAEASAKSEWGQAAIYMQSAAQIGALIPDLIAAETRGNLVSESAALASSILTTASAAKAAQDLAGKITLGPGQTMRDLSLLVDGVGQYDNTGFYEAFVRISDALGKGQISNEQYSTLFDYALGTYQGVSEEAKATATAFERLRDSMRSFADALLIGDKTTLSPEATLAEMQRQYAEAFNAAGGGDTEAISKYQSLANGLLDKSLYSTKAEYNVAFGRAYGDARALESQGVNVLAQQQNGVVTELKALNASLTRRVGDLERILAQIAKNTAETSRGVEGLAIT